MGKNKVYFYLLAILSGLCLWLGWPTKNATFFVFVGFVPLLFIEDYLYRNRVPSPVLKLFIFTFIAFFIWNLSTTFWIRYATLPGAISAVFINTLLMTLPWIIFLKLKLASGRRLSFIFLAAFWLSFEFLHLNWQLAWPWLTLGNAFAMKPDWVQWYEYTGVAGGSLWIWSVNLLIFSIIRRVSFFRDETISNFKLYLRTFQLLLFIGAPILISYWVKKQVQPSRMTDKNVVIVQPNIDPYNEKFTSSLSHQVNILQKLSLGAADSNTWMFLWPETAISSPQDESTLSVNAYFMYLADFLKSFPDAKILSGLDSYRFFKEGEKITPTARFYAKDSLWYDRYNAAFLMDKNLNFQIYHKAKLVPGVEKMPYPRLFGFLENWIIDLGGTSGSLGQSSEPEVFHLNDSIHLAPIICYESVFGEYCGKYVVKGANALTIITNDGWWRDTDGHRQHFQYARLRAIELRKPVYRSANTGISGFINEKGEIIIQTGWWEEDAVKVPLAFNNKLTFYARNGDYLMRISAFVSVLILLIYSVRSFIKEEIPQKSI